MTDLVVVQTTGNTVVVQESGVPQVIEVVTVGPQGPSGTLSIGTVTTGNAGSSASVTNSGNSAAAVLNFVIPRGNTGDITPQLQALADSSTTAAQAAAASQTAATTKASEAAASATSASGSASTATTKASEASTSASTATTKAADALTQATNAASSATAAQASATASDTSKVAAQTAATTATTQAGISTTKAGEAATSAATATTKAAEATGSATTATTQAGIATTKASEAATSATAAAGSATSASGSATTATTQATLALTKAGEASTSATAAGTSATNSASSASAAAGSATTATTQAGVATTKAGEASTSAATASTKASEASVSATAAATAKNAAESARDQTLAAFDSFDDRYLGQKSSDPTVDNDGNALISGALYYNSAPLASGGGMKVYDGSAWLAAYASLSGALISANNLSDLASASAARINLVLGNVENKSAATILGELTSGNVTTALGFTPYNASNPSGFITNSALAPYLTSSTAASTYQAALVSGTSIKTVNGVSVLGSGNIQIDGGVVSFNTRTGAVTLSSGDVTSALGFTPVNKAGDTMTGPIVSAGINYTPPGAGAVQRTLESKVNETVSVTDFGAVGDGTTEDTAAVQAAINSGAKFIVFPAGKTFLIDQVVSAGTDTTFHVVGATIKLKANSAIYRPLRINHDRCTVLGGTWDGNRANQTAGDAFGSWAIGLHADDCVVRGATIKEFRGCGVKMVGASRCLVELCNITAIGYSTSSTCYGIYSETLVGIPVYGNRALNNFIQLGNNGIADQGILFTSNSTTGGEAQWDWEISGNRVYGSLNESAEDLAINLAVRGHRGKVTNNKTTGGSMGWSEGGNKTIIEGNTFIDTLGTVRWGIEPSGDDMIIQGNYLQGHIRGICFSFADNDNMVINGNTIISDSASSANQGIAMEIPSGGTGLNITVSGNIISSKKGIVATRNVKGLLVTGNNFIGPGSATANSRAVVFDTPTSLAINAKIDSNRIVGMERAVEVYSASATTYTDVAFTNNYCRDDVGGGVFAYVAPTGSALLGSRIKTFGNEQNSSSDNFNLLFDQTNRRGIEYSNSYATPEGNVTAGVGSIYVNLAGGNPVLWVKNSGTGNTGWGQLVSATGTQTLTNKTFGSGTSFTAPLTGNFNEVNQFTLRDYGYVAYDNGASNTLYVSSGPCQRWAPATGAQTLTITGWPVMGTLGELLIEGVNLGAATITWPTINWVKNDGTTTTTFSSNGVTLQTSGIDWVLLWSRDGTTIYGKVVR